MSTKTQTEKNLELMEKLTKLLLAHPEIDDKLPKDAPLVIISAEDKALNEINDKPNSWTSGRRKTRCQGSRNKK
jgi:hypothetical protein